MSGFLGMRKFGSLIDERTKQRGKNQEDLIPFGVNYLDDALEGILKNDLVLITAPSGVGKTELVSQIALNAARRGKRIYFLALESYPGEVEERLIYKAAVQRFYADPQRAPGLPDYLKWAHGKQESFLSKYYPEAEKEIRAFRDLIDIRDGGEPFGLEDFTKVFVQAARADGAQLVILDHLHYMDHGDEDDNRGYKKALMKMQELIKDHGVPVILVAHIRKRDRKAKVVAPGMEDIHGSSDIFKMVTKMISIAKAPAEHGGKTRWPTYMRTAKCRYGGARDQYVGICVFDVTTNSYETSYEVGQLSYLEDEVEILAPTERPHWYRSERSRALERGE